MERVNIKYLAKELKMSVSTVSRALHDSYEISEKTKKKVLELARKLDYQPDPNASGLREKRTYRIALVIPEVANNFFSLAIDGIESVAADRKYHVQIYLTHENQEKEIAFVKQLSNGRADGIIMSVAGDQANTHLTDLMGNKTPLVFFDRVPSNIDQPSVSTDDYESTFKATEHLIEKGCKRIGCLVVLDNVSIGIKRRQGYLDAVEKHGLEVFTLDCSNDIQEYSKEIHAFLKNVKPDGLFTSVEKLAVSAYYSCLDLGLKIPSDVKVVSFSNLPTAALLNPSLTTVTQPAFEIGKEAATILFNLINDKPVHEKTIVIKSELIERQSTQ
jgi:LacI family transcriptional regulator